MRHEVHRRFALPQRVVSSAACVPASTGSAVRFAVYCIAVVCFLRFPLLCAHAARSACFAAAAQRGPSDPDFPRVAGRGQLPPLDGAAEARLASLEAAFHDAYGTWSEPWELAKAEKQQYFDPRDAAPVYGELNQAAVASLFLDAGLGPQHSLVDVGAGLGKLVVVAAVFTGVAAAWGVELSPSRHAKSLQGVQRLRGAGALSEAEYSRIRLVQGDCAESLPGEALASSHLLLTMRKSHESARKLRDVLRRVPLASGRPRTIWSVGHHLRMCPGMTYERCFEVPGYLHPPKEGPRAVADGKVTKGFVVHEYSLLSSGPASATPPAMGRAEEVLNAARGLV